MAISLSKDRSLAMLKNASKNSQIRIQRWMPFRIQSVIPCTQLLLW